MKTVLPLVAFGAGAAAAVLRRELPCTFVMSAIGSPNGTIEEDTIGENRIGGSYPPGSYSIVAHVLTDAENRTCQIYPSTLQFECSQASTGSTNFSLANDGSLLHDGSSTWLACLAGGPGEDGSYNIFSHAKTNPTGCQQVTLLTGGFSCAVLGSSNTASSPASTSSTTSVSSGQTPLPTHLNSGATTIETLSVSTTSTGTPSSTSSSTTCPTDISSGTFQSPHLIIPTSPEAPDNAFGNQYEASISPINRTLFNFDIPSHVPYTGGTCALLFLFPFVSDLDPSAGKYYFSGVEEEEGEHGGLEFALLIGVADAATTYSTTPPVGTDYGMTEILPGNNYTIAMFTCPGGETVTYSISSQGNVELDYFQDSAPSPIGLYVVPCV